MSQVDDSDCGQTMDSANSQSAQKQTVKSDDDPVPATLHDGDDGAVLSAAKQTESFGDSTDIVIVNSDDATEIDSLSDIEQLCCIERFKVPDGASVYVVGTAHVSSKSCDDVQTIINRVKPQVLTEISCVHLRMSALFVSIQDRCHIQYSVISLVTCAAGRSPRALCCPRGYAVPYGAPRHFDFRARYQV